MILSSAADVCRWLTPVIMCFAAATLMKEVWDLDISLKMFLFFDHVDKKKNNMMTHFFILKESKTTEILKLTKYKKNSERRETTWGQAQKNYCCLEQRAELQQHLKGIFYVLSYKNLESIRRWMQQSGYMFRQAAHQIKGVDLIKVVRTCLMSDHKKHLVSFNNINKKNVIVRGCWWESNIRRQHESDHKIGADRCSLWSVREETVLWPQVQSRVLDGSSRSRFGEAGGVLVVEGFVWVDEVLFDLRFHHSPSSQASFFHCYLLMVTRERTSLPVDADDAHLSDLELNFIFLVKISAHWEPVSSLRVV